MVFQNAIARVSIVVAALCASQLHAAIVVSDGTFVFSNYDRPMISTYSGALSGGNGSVMTGGNPNEFWRHQAQFIPTGTGGALLMAINNTVSYNPLVDGAASNFQFTMDFLKFSQPYGLSTTLALQQEVGFVVRQGGNLYATIGTTAPSADQWHNLNASLTSSDFGRLTTSLSPNFLQNPNFATGGPIEFGFFSRAVGVGSSLSTYQFGFDNFQVASSTVAVPEPATLTLWSGIGLAALVGVARRRKQPSA